MPAANPNFTALRLDDIFDEALDKEFMGKVRKIDLPNGNIVWLKCEDPYGFWYVSLKKGQVPENLKGAYSNFAVALNAVNLWLKDKKDPIVYPSSKV